MSRIALIIDKSYSCQKTNAFLIIDHIMKYGYTYAQIIVRVREWRICQKEYIAAITWIAVSAEMSVIAIAVQTV